MKLMTNTGKRLGVLLLTACILLSVPGIPEKKALAAEDPNNVYVSETGDDSSGDGSRGSPYATIQKGVDEAGSNGTVYIMAGDYTLISAVIIDKDLTLQGPAEGAEIKVEDGGYRHITSSADNIYLTLENLTLTGINDDTSGGGGVAMTGNDSKLYMGNCTVWDCYTDDDGAVAMTGPGSILNMANCTVMDNTAANDEGGGIHGESAVNLTNCTVTGNKVTGIGSVGGGIFSRAAVNLANCTVTGNEAEETGGGVFAGTLGASPPISGSIVAGNTATVRDVYIAATPWQASAPTDTNNYSIIGYCGTAADGKIYDAITIFGTDTPTPTDNGGLTQTILINPNGPAYNGVLGTGQGYNIPIADQRGITRPQGANADIGAVELECFALTIAAGAGGTITTGMSGDYAEGEIVNISAAADSGYTFRGWSAMGGGSFGSAGSDVTTFTMPANTATVRANFRGNASSGTWNPPALAPEQPVAPKTAFPAQGKVTVKRVSVYKYEKLRTRLFYMQKDGAVTLLGLADNGRVFRIEKDGREGYIAMKDIKAEFGTALKGTALRKARAYTKLNNGKFKRIGYYPKGHELWVHGIEGKYLVSRRSEITYYLDAGQWRLNLSVADGG